MTSKIAALLGLAACFSCGGNSSGPTGGKTNWLSACTRDVDCAALSQAICERRMCTRSCASNDDCAHLGDGLVCEPGFDVCVVGDATNAIDDGAAPTLEPPGFETTEMQDSGVDPGVSDSAAPSVFTSTLESDGAAAVPSMMTEGSTGDDMQVVEPAACSWTTIDPNQGNPAPDESECVGIGETLEAAHDSALEGPALEVALLAGAWLDASGGLVRVELTLDASGHGTLRFGDPADYPTPSASDETFLTTTGPADASNVFDQEHLRPQAGFGHTVITETGSGSEMSFHILTVEAWDPWCALQEPVYSPDAPSCHACTEVAPIYSFTSGDACGETSGCYASDKEASEERRVHCGRVELCAMPYSSVCACSATKCFANVAMSGQLNWYPYAAELDPVDNDILMLRSLSELNDKTTYYLERLRLGE